MHPTVWEYALAGGGVFLLGLFCFLAYRVRYWVREGNKLQNEPGYITPRVTVFARYARWFMSRAAVWYKVGRFTVIGREHLAGPRRKIIMPNHQIEHDAVVIPAALRTLYFRGMMSINQIRGYRKAICAWLGVVPMRYEDDDRGSITSIKVAVKVLKAEKDSSTVIFSQGTLIRNNVLVLEEFHPGAIAIARMAGEKGQPNPFWVVPCGVYYDRDQRHASWFHRLVRWVGVKGFRSWFGENTVGVTLIFGEPIAIDALPAKRDLAIAEVFNKIKELSDRARAETLAYFGEKVEPAVSGS